MIDGRLRPLIDPPLNFVGRTLAAFGVKGDHVTYAAMPFAVAAGIAAAFEATTVMLVCIAVNRIFDGLDGATARAGGKTDYGGFLDVAGDFLFFAALPLGFAFAGPDNALPAAALLAAILLTGANFLAFAASAKERALENRAQGEKSLYYMNGLMEGAETIAVFVIFALFPGHFSWLAWIAAGLYAATAVQRVLIARRLLC